MNKVLIALLLIGILALTTSCNAKAESTPEESTTQNNNYVEPSCPRGMAEDPYPGACFLYVDNDGNHICDLS